MLNSLRHALPVSVALAAATFAPSVSPRVFAVPGDSKTVAPRQDAPISTWRPRVEWRAAGTAGELVVNGKTVTRFRHTAGGVPPYQRAQIAAARLEASLAGLAPETVRVDTVSNPDAPRLVAGGELIATVTAAPVTPPTKGSARARKHRLEAAIHDARHEAEAEVTLWARSLKAALAIPGLVVTDNGRVVPVGEARVLRLGGAARGPVRITTASGDTPFVSVKIDDTHGIVSVTGLKPGREVLTLEREGAVETVYLAVKSYAGTFEPAHLTVTGYVAPKEMVEHHALAVALNSARPTPGAWARIIGDASHVADVRAGQTHTVVVPVRITGPDMLPVEKRVVVSVSNALLPRVPTNTLFYSNNPERLEKPGVLFTGQIHAGGNTEGGVVSGVNGGATRLLYHHQSATTRPLRFVAELVNENDAPCRVQIIGGDAGPERDTVWVGYRAGAGFVSAIRSDTGAVVQVPARSRVALSSLRLPPGLTISGLMQLRVVSGPAPIVRIVAEEMDTAARVALVPLPIGVSAQTAMSNASEHVYNQPQQQVAAKYSVGGKWTFVPLGRDALHASTSHETKLHGNYGVFYDIHVKMDNPTANPTKARVVFEPSAGLAGGVFVVNDKEGDRTVEIPRTNMPDETTLASYTLAPGETRDVSIRTLPLSGSNYPATIIVRP